ncbi:hypothetical protein [Vibrio fortis]|uniref:hypothetical protein n=1 Tax=Vibrio fortis TaxID=212667 RepID=UPI0021C475F2|nr:hypothetical protein [Vibrio fortis]
MFLNHLFSELNNKIPLSLILTEREKSTELSIFSKGHDEFDFQILKYDSLHEAEFVLEALEHSFSEGSRVVSDRSYSRNVKRQRRVFIDNFDNLTLYENHDRVQLVADCILNQRITSYNVFFNSKQREVMNGYELENVALQRLN